VQPANGHIPKMKNFSPLRYPGGKSKLAPFLEQVINRACSSCRTYIEPFAGGAGVALNLLFSGNVENIIINDKDKAIYSFWKAILQEPDAFLKKIESTPVTINEWHRQKSIYKTEKKYSLELGFATFFLNRTNRSGILTTAGPMGGYAQAGNWSIDSRYKKIDLIRKIEQISTFRHKIKIYNQDIFCFVKTVIQKHSEESFVYFDPPYYVKGKKLYHNFFIHNDHVRLADCIASGVKCPWVVTYDNSPEIAEIYKNFTTRTFDIEYSVSKRGIGTEIVIFKDVNYLPPGHGKKKLCFS